MKYLISWLTGALVGAALLAAAIYYNPLFDRQGVSPLAVTGQPLIDLSFSGVPADAIAYTDSGDTRISPHPEKIDELWEPAIRKSRVFVTLLSDNRGRSAGIGIKFMSDSESTRLLRGEVIKDSVWHVWLPGSGSFMVDQTENMWSYIRNIVIPARWNSADSWRGTWQGITTDGPNALRTARVSGGSGRFSGSVSEAVETLSARAYSAVQGPVAMSGNLTITVSDLTAEE